MAEPEKDISRATQTGRSFSGFSILLTGVAVITVVIGASIGSPEVRLTGGFIAVIAILYVIAGTLLLAVSEKRGER